MKVDLRLRKAAMPMPIKPGSNAGVGTATTEPLLIVAAALTELPKMLPFTVSVLVAGLKKTVLPAMPVNELAKPSTKLKVNDQKRFWLDSIR